MRRFAVLLAAAGLLVWLAAPALTSRPFVPQAVEFEQALTTSEWIRSAGGTWRSAVITAPRRFDLVGLRWRRGAPSETRIRVRDARSGRWARWTTMADDHAGGSGAEPVWAGAADAYQLRMDRRPRGLQARFVNATGTATAPDRLRTSLRRTAHSALAAISATTRPAHAQTTAPGGGRAAPAIIPREAWGADQCKPRAAPSYGAVQLGYAHHTVNANTYSPQDSAAIVLSICRYHRNGNGWRDIGYNFLVDRYGQVFEGRAGGVEEPVIGAQAQGYNAVSTGVANIGTFSQEPQTAAGVAATAELLAWKLSLHGAPVTGRVMVRSAGGPSNRYPSGRLVAFERIAAHRDADATSCPGDAFFAQLPQIRERAAQLAPQYAFAPPSGSVSLAAADSTLDFPQQAQLSGRATGAGGGPLGGAPIAVQIAAGSRFVTGARATANADGMWAAALPTQYSRSLRAVATLSDGALVSSPRVEVAVAPRLRVRAPRRVTARRQFTVSGSIRPRRARVVVEIARQGSDRRMRTVARVAVQVRRGRFASPVRLRRPALHRIRVTFAGDQRNDRARSGDIYLRAVRRR